MTLPTTWEIERILFSSKVGIENSFCFALYVFYLAKCALTTHNCVVLCCAAPHFLRLLFLGLGFLAKLQIPRRLFARFRDRTVVTRLQTAGQLCKSVEMIS